MKSGPSNGKLYTEEDWNTDSEADKEGGYAYSKVGCPSLLPALQVVLCCLAELHEKHVPHKQQVAHVVVAALVIVIADVAVLADLSTGG